MTREEIISNLLYMKCHVKEDTIEDMTIDEAIKALESVTALSADLKAVDRDSMDEKTLIGFNMAVALFNKHFGGAEVTLNVTDTNVGNMDLISRKDLLSWLDSTLERSDKMFDSEIATLKAVKDRVANMPSVVRENRTGQWIERFDESGKWYECDQCHTDWGGSVNYCPNCGARMDGGEQA